MRCGKFLFLVDGREGYGVERTVIELALALRLKGINVEYVALCDGRLAERLAAEGIKGRVIGLGLKKYTRSGLWEYVGVMINTAVAVHSSVRELRAIAREVDVVYLHNRAMLTFGCLMIAGGISKGIWHISNTILPRRWLGLQRFIYQFICRLSGMKPIGNSRHTAESLGRGIYPAEPVLLGVDPVRFVPIAYDQRSALRKDMEIKEDSIVFLVMARIIPSKAQDRVVDAAIRLLREGYQFELLIAGGPTEGHYYQKIVNRINESGFAGSIRMVGYVSDPRACYGVCDVVVNSRADAEPFGNTVIEAMLMERPVLAYYLGGPAETVIDGETGWLLPGPSVDDYCTGLKRAIKDAGRWQEMGRSGRRRAEREFSSEAFAERVLTVCERL